MLPGLPAAVRQRAATSSGRASRAASNAALTRPASTHSGAAVSGERSCGAVGVGAVDQHTANACGCRDPGEAGSAGHPVTDTNGAASSAVASFGSRPR